MHHWLKGMNVPGVRDLLKVPTWAWRIGRVDAFRPEGRGHWVRIPLQPPCRDPCLAIMHLLREIEKLFCDLAARDVPSQYKSSQTGDQRQFSESRRNVTGRFIRLDQGLPVSSSSTTDVKQELPKHSDQVHALGKRSFYSVHEREDLGFNHLL